MRKAILTAILVLISGLSWGQQYNWRYQSSADCDALTTGKFADLCYQTADDTLWKCVPSGGADTTCDTATEWEQVKSGEIVDHSALNNLDYASSGHTGFQPAGDYLTEETDPIWEVDKSMYQTASQADAKYLQSYDETDPVYSAWDKDYADIINTPDLSVYLTDAPSDDKTYGRLNGGWAEVTTTETDPIYSAWDKSYDDLIDTPDLSIYAMLDGTNQPFTGDVEVQGSIFANVTINGVPPEFEYGSGGDTVTDITVGDDTYRVHKFTSLGSATFTAPAVAELQILVVGGGGGGGLGTANIGGGGGGGAGGYVSQTYEPSVGEQIAVVVGDGGAAQTDGNQSSFGDVIAYGGGKGGTNSAGSNGASGGGGSVGSKAGGIASYGAQGNSGGNGDTTGAGHGGGGGGGGSGSVGANATNYVGANGGSGTSNDITGTSVTYAAGGKGGGNGTAGAAGANGAANTGNGGGGSGQNGGTVYAAGKGGSGVVIVKYLVAEPVGIPSLLFKDDSVAKWEIKSDGNDSHNLKIIDAGDTAKITIEQGGDTTFVGDLAANNLSGTNTGDQDLSGYPLKTEAVMLDQSTPQTITATDVTITESDEIYYGDATDSFKIKKDTIQGILDLVPSPDLSGLVPYTGATSDVNLGIYDLTATELTSLGKTILTRDSGNVLIGTTTDDSTNKLQVNGQSILGGNTLIAPTGSSATRQTWYGIPFALEVQFNPVNNGDGGNYSYPMGFRNTDGVGGNFVFTSFSSALATAHVGMVQVENDKGGFSFSGSNDIAFKTNGWTSTPSIIVKKVSDGNNKIGINTSAPDKALEVNLGTSSAMRLTYNDKNGSATKYTDFTVASTGATTITNTANIFTFGNGVADTDYTVNFTGTTNSGVFKWMEDEDYFQFSDDVMLPDNEAVKFGTGINASIHYDGTNLIINPKAVGSGILDVLGTLQTDGYNSSDGTAGATADVATLAPDGTTTRTLHFKNGLYTGYTDS